MDRVVRRGMLVASIGTMLSCGATKNAGSDKQVTIPWQAKPIVADGNNDDWASPYSYMDGNAKIQYSFSNDKDNLYITVKASDRITKMKMLTAGMQVLVDMQGKKSQNTGILYPLPDQQPLMMEVNDAKAEFAPGRNAEAAKLFSKLIGRAKEFSLQGFNECNGVYPIAQSNKCGIETRIGVDVNDELVWEAIVPFKSVYKGALDSSDLGKTISICMKINALKRPEMPPAMGAPPGRAGGGMPPPGGGGPGGGGPGPGMGGPDMEGQMKAFDATTTWAKIRLAYNGG